MSLRWRAYDRQQADTRHDERDQGRRKPQPRPRMDPLWDLPRECDPVRGASDQDAQHDGGFRTNEIDQLRRRRSNARRTKPSKYGKDADKHSAKGGKAADGVVGIVAERDDLSQDGIMLQEHERRPEGEGEADDEDADDRSSRRCGYVDFEVADSGVCMAPVSRRVISTDDVSSRMTMSVAG